jgi:UDP-N-acetylglucosamine 2-epimerase
MIKIATIVGARPQFIKAAVVSRAILDHNKINNLDSVRINEKIIFKRKLYGDGSAGKKIVKIIAKGKRRG